MSHHLPLGKEDSIPAMGFGTYKVQGPEGQKVIEEALNCGYRLLDTADLYRNHEEVGNAMQHFQRKNIFLTTKIWHTDLTYDASKAKIISFLKELKTDYLDLLLIHWPSPDTSCEGALRAMQEAKNEGLIKHIGVSNFTVELLKEALSYCPNIVNNQVEFHPYLNQQELYDFCQKENISLTAYRPIARGAVLNDPQLIEIAKKYDATPAQITLAWLYKKGIASIPKTSSIGRLKTNLSSLEINLSKEDFLSIESLDQNARQIPGDMIGFTELFDKK